jgi:hypothetical protein
MQVAADGRVLVEDDDEAGERALAEEVDVALAVERGARVVDGGSVGRSPARTNAAVVVKRRHRRPARRTRRRARRRRAARMAGSSALEHFAARLLNLMPLRSNGMCEPVTMTLRQPLRHGDTPSAPASAPCRRTARATVAAVDARAHHCAAAMRGVDGRKVAAEHTVSPVLRAIGKREEAARVHVRFQVGDVDSPGRADRSCQRPAPQRAESGRESPLTEINQSIKR